MSSEFILAHEAPIRLGFFVGIFIVVTLAEVFDPRRPLLTSKRSRWFSNISIVAINTVVLRLGVVTPDTHRVCIFLKGRLR